MLQALIDAGSSVQVTDDFGRTPLHDACWTSQPNFDTIRLLLDQDPWLLWIMDCRGSTPLGYVRKAHWAVWIGFLGAIADRYWPDLTNFDGTEMDTNQQQPVTAPPLSFVEANSRPVSDPKFVNGMTLEILELLANGKVSPQELKKNVDDSSKSVMKNRMPPGGLVPATAKTTTQPVSKGLTTMYTSRITLDPLRPIGSNATTMMKQSSSSSFSSAFSSAASLVKAAGGAAARGGVGGGAKSQKPKGFVQVLASGCVPGLHQGVIVRK